MEVVERVAVVEGTEVVEGMEVVERVAVVEERKSRRSTGGRGEGKEAKRE